MRLMIKHREQLHLSFEAVNGQSGTDVSTYEIFREVLEASGKIHALLTLARANLDKNKGPESQAMKTWTQTEFRLAK